MYLKENLPSFTRGSPSKIETAGLRSYGIQLFSISRKLPHSALTLSLGVEVIFFLKRAHQIGGDRV